MADSWIYQAIPQRILKVVSRNRVMLIYPKLTPPEFKVTDVEQTVFNCIFFEKSWTKDFNGPGNRVCKHKQLLKYNWIKARCRRRS